MSKLKGNLLYAQSGGPTSVINSSLYGTIVEAKKHEEIEKIYLGLNGLEGILKEKLVTDKDIDDIELLKQTPGAFLGSCRYKIPDSSEDSSIYFKLLEIFKKYNIRYFFYNGGNDSMDTCYKISKFFKQNSYELRVMGIPKTIDNDLANTDHCPGFASASSYIANTVANIVADSKSYPEGKITVIEVMGRNAGWLTLSSYLAILSNLGPDLVYLPEEEFDIEKFKKDVIEIYNKKKYVVAVVSEGIKDKEGNLILKNKPKDSFGHMQMGGVCFYLTSLFENYKTRPIELSLAQRADSLTITTTDSKEAINSARYAVKKAVHGISDKMVIIKRISSKPYKIKYGLCNLNEVADFEKKVPLELIKEAHNGNINNIKTYICPLIEKHIKIKTKNGIVKFAKLK